MKLTDTESKFVELTSRLVMLKVEKLPGHPFGHAFLWGNITIRRRLKNGTLKTFMVRECLGSICCADLSEAVRVAETVDDVSGVWYNLD
jgi:hypothetical protein